MFLVRESFREDVDEILALARHLDTVNLPAERGLIEGILERSERSFNQEVEPPEREYVFVLEEKETGRIVGTSMIHAQHGTRRSPHVYFQVLQEERYSETLDRYMVHECLRLAYNYNGPTEIGGLILLPEYRRRPERLGTVLSYLRFLFIAMHRATFQDQVISELLPPLNPDGTSRLWEHLGRRFTGLDYLEADRLSKDNKEFIRALFPHELIYTSLFPEDVREMIGQVGPETRGVEKILRRIGFAYARQIDPFDGGPHFVADTDQITVVKESRPAKVAAAETQEAEESGRWMIVAAEGEQRPKFRAVGTRTGPSAEGELGLAPKARELLGVRPGDDVWAVAP